MEKDELSSSWSCSRPLRVAVEGNIGSGKSTFLEHCRPHSSVEVVPEPVNEWQNVGGVNLLEKFYANPQQWAVTFQSYVALTTVENHIRHTSRPIRMTERSIQSSRNCFIEAMFENGTIELGMLNVLNRWMNFLSSTLSMKPDVIVYIHTSPSTARARIVGRARPEENGVSVTYIEQLHRLHVEWIERETVAMETLVYTLDGDLPLEELKCKYAECMRSLELLLL